MASTDSTLYSPSEAGLERSPSSTVDSDATLCAPGEQEFDSEPPKGRRRKSVTFSAYVTSVSSAAKDASSSTVPLSKSLFRDTRNISSSQLPKKDERNDSAPRKRGFSCLATSAGTSNASVEADVQPSPRKRRVSDAIPLSDRDFERQSKLGRLARDSLQLFVPQSKEARTSSLQLPSNLFDEINRRVRRTFNRPSFDFAKFSLHRKYVLRNVVFSPSSDQCVVLLDAAVLRLLPETYPPLALQDEKPKFLIDMAEGKGKGVFARTSLSVGECILAERPVLIAPYLIAMGFPITQFYGDLFSKLPLELLEFMKHPATEGTAEAFESTLQHHALAISLDVPNDDIADLPQHRAIFPQMTRFNHSCGPNAQWKWDLSTFSLILTAVRPIKAGEEISIGYVAPQLPGSERQSMLRNLYGFDCICTFCHSRPQTAGDEARAKLLSFLDDRNLPSFDEWCKDTSLPSNILIDAHLEAVRLMDREGLHILGGSRHVEVLAMCYGALADVPNFKKWIERALESRGEARSDHRTAFRKWISNPMSFPAWAKRMDQCNATTTSAKKGHSKTVSVSGLDAFKGMGVADST